MRLVFSGGWIGKGGLYQARIKRVSFLKSLHELSPESFPCFLVLSYHLASEVFGLPIKTSSLPLVVLVEIESFKAIDPREKRVSLTLLESSISDEGFKEKVNEVKKLIEEGIVYQINLTNRFTFSLKGDPFDLFLKFYARQPVDYAFFLDLDDFYIISGSMELFLRREGKKLRSEPIKGTASKREELKKSEKDRAENLMITDVVRNDLGIVGKCVEVKDLFGIRKYKTLYHMYSAVECETTASLKAILFATFPPASVTGAPKRKAVEVIDSLEPHCRDLYCGCAGFLKSEEDFTLSVLIRTALGDGKTLSYYAGCGIVWDSDPQKELREVYLKMKAFFSTST
ncbi:Chorismate binding protein [Hydrogenobacter thermophilus TK-6]|uniref:Para-aminobenzoate synthase component I n=1 Tax=Hydrogenobacter thermophilus (strain DSM 6534 / IAM 12695 / TK-6) TaxID=608538 RepID=D3DG77_HYDTT|nr:anthranilate synthase component I family protein [Hydrogenobacter thermophilus]ADO44764.1 Chorismate binding protein [Hydrogenobacter thermophilus TK-6]BAI68829.1 para-aminobenzoate synthase component I [Hydrogenobacter thermophilus TK-6]